jgi:hypothetical protein
VFLIEPRGCFATFGCARWNARTNTLYEVLVRDGRVHHEHHDPIAVHAVTEDLDCVALSGSWNALEDQVLRGPEIPRNPGGFVFGLKDRRRQRGRRRWRGGRNSIRRQAVLNGPL